MGGSSTRSGSMTTARAARSHRDRFREARSTRATRGVLPSDLTTTKPEGLGGGSGRATTAPVTSAGRGPGLSRARRPGRRRHRGDWSWSGPESGARTGGIGAGQVNCPVQRHVGEGQGTIAGMRATHGAAASNRAGVVLDLGSVQRG